jgi:hypothetical protein
MASVKPKGAGRSVRIIDHSEAAIVIQKTVYALCCIHEPSNNLASVINSTDVGLGEARNLNGAEAATV